MIDHDLAQVMRPWKSATMCLCVCVREFAEQCSMDGVAEELEERGRDGGAGEAGGGSYQSNMVAEHDSDPCLQEAMAEEAAGDGGLGGINDSKTNERIEAEGDGSGPREACRIRFEIKQQDENIV